MTCWKCKVSSPLNQWVVCEVKCISSSCSEVQARKCPECGTLVNHIWLDAQKEFRESEFYKP